MTKQEALEEIEERVANADSIGSDYCDCVSKEALVVAIEMLTKNISQCCELEEETMAFLSTEEVLQIIQRHHWLLGEISRHLIQNKEGSMKVGVELVGDMQKKVLLHYLKYYCGCNCEILNVFGDVVTMKISMDR